MSEFIKRSYIVDHTLHFQQAPLSWSNRLPYPRGVKCSVSAQAEQFPNKVFTFSVTLSNPQPHSYAVLED